MEKLLLDLALAYGDAQFACGEWDQDDDERYEVVWLRSRDAWEAFSTALRTAVQPHEVNQLGQGTV